MECYSRIKDSGGLICRYGTPRILVREVKAEHLTACAVIGIANTAYLIGAFGSVIALFGLLMADAPNTNLILKIFAATVAVFIVRGAAVMCLYEYVLSELKHCIKQKVVFPQITADNDQQIIETLLEECQKQRDNAFNPVWSSKGW